MDRESKMFVCMLICTTIGVCLPLIFDRCEKGVRLILTVTALGLCILLGGVLRLKEIPARPPAQTQPAEHP